ncbi:DUF3298 and DUF4163 domain-containing protein [uncultured Dysosmobacter sp.]|uniref:DUF3298 and DUF4163 domain-containing protein n=1 Tax=uncultured Dysosmobacter sp. TaxID=2591384 RepID=UPI002671616E|nr:DUF3298 and DUF4163 domain-containing protein [uncultured Dysosmobacter sp.]
MKKYCSLILTLCLAAALAGCGITTLPTPEDPEPPAAADPEEITYEVTTDPHEETVHAEDGTLLMTVSFQLPHLQAYADGTLIETPATPAQEEAMARVNTFNENFNQWRESGDTAQSMEDAKSLYQSFPDAFSNTSYCEEFTYTAYRTGSLISIAADYYSYLGGAHPNDVYFSWNFDLDSSTFLTIPELATDPQAFTLAVADMIEVQAGERFASEPEYEGLSISDIYWDNYRETIEKWGSDYAASFDADGLTVIFSAYELASYANGPQEFHIPYAALDTYWSDSGRTVLGLD